MKNKQLAGLLIACISLFSLCTPLAFADTLERTDFMQPSFSKTVDYFDYVRAYATANGVQTPESFSQWHANLYTTYINNSGLKLFYAGLESITTDEETYLTIPMQSFLMHYKTNNTRDAILASTFLMLLAFNETSTSLYPNSPDQTDVLYASFSLGYDLSQLNATLPILNSKTEIIPLQNSADGQHWTWGMKYTNLTALWWRTWVDPENPHFENSWPLALTVYDELTFTYQLTINPTAGTATLQENHVIGRMRDLIVGILPILWTHYNSTGTYGMAGRRIGDQTIHDFIQVNGLKMSIVNFQTSIVADHSTYSTTPAGVNVAETETQVSSQSIDTYTDDGEKISTTDFGAKQTYKLYNFTSDATETTFNSYDSVTRTISAAGFAGNGGLFALHIGLLNLLPLVVVHMYPALFARAMDTLSNMSKANYWYTIAYPQYSGYKVEHDPIFTAYIAQQLAPSQTTPAPLTTATPPPDDQPNGNGVLILAGIIIVTVAVAIIMLRRRTKAAHPQ